MCEFFQACEVEFHIVSQAEAYALSRGTCKKNETRNRMPPMHVQVTIKKHVFETGCSPRTRMLTRMINGTDVEKHGCSVA